MYPGVCFYGTKIRSTFLIIAGERRYRACKQLGWHEIPCVVMQSTEEEQMWIMLSENIQRKDLNEVEKADTLKAFMSSGTTRPTFREAGKKLGVHFDYVRHLYNLAGLPTEVKQMVKAGEISAKSVRPLSQYNEKNTPTEHIPALQVKTAEYIRDNRMTYEEAKQTVDKIFFKNL